VGRGDLLIGLGVGIGIGATVGYLFFKWRQSPTTVKATSFTRDEQGRIIEIIERPM